MNEGHSAAWDQEWDKAITSYRKALEEFPDQPKALNSLGLALYQVGQFEEALQTYQYVARLSPNDPVPFEKVAQLSERLGDLRMAVESAMRAADLYLNQRDVDKALENWVRVTTLNPEHAAAHSRLALVHEKIGHAQQAVTEYLAIASIFQRAGNAEKTQEMVDKALQLMPANPEARQAQTLLKTGQLLPKPVRTKGGTGPIRMAQVKQLQKPKQTESGLDPIAEARQKALSQLAEILFEYSDESPAASQERRGLAAIMRGTGQLSMQSAEQTKVVLHLGLAIDALSRNQDAQAAEELDRALEAGFSHPSLYFVLGLLRSRGDRLESAQRHLQHAVKHNDYNLAARLLQGQILNRKGQVKEASLEYLEALRLADALVVPADQADEVRQLYEPLIETQQNQTDEEACRRLCDNVNGLLARPDWRDQLHKSREQMPKQEGGLMPIAEVLMQAQSSQVLESINRVHQLARLGFLRPAMAEAFDAVQHAPTYLPLHTLIGDLLIQEGRPQDAIVKFSVVAHAYGVRGEVAQATKLLRRVIQLAPMDLSARTRLIDQLVARGMVDDAINEYLELADIHYRLAELDLARKTYTTALRVVQQSNADRAWNVHILQRMADIDMQRLNWKQALRVFEQIRTLHPDDANVRKNLVDLNLRMGQDQQAMTELEGYITYLESKHQTEPMLQFLEELVAEHDDQPLLRRAWAEQLHRAGRTDEAVAQLDLLGETFLGVGKKREAMEVIQKIILMNPANVEDYRALLEQVRQGNT